MLRAVVLTLALAPFLAYAARDFAAHRRDRRVPRLEQLAHGTLAIVVAALVGAAYAGNAARFLAALALFVIAGAIDELGFHHALPPHESNLHAKEHFCLLLFVAVVLVYDGRETLASLARSLR